MSSMTLNDIHLYFRIFASTCNMFFNTKKEPMVTKQAELKVSRAESSTSQTDLSDKTIKLAEQFSLPSRNSSIVTILKAIIKSV